MEEHSVDSLQGYVGNYGGLCLNRKLGQLSSLRLEVRKSPLIIELYNANRQQAAQISRSVSNKATKFIGKGHGLRSIRAGAGIV